MEKMKRAVALWIALMLAMMLCACGKVTEETIELAYGETYKIENEKLKGRDLTWSSSDDQIVGVSNWVVTAKGPGEATVFAKEGDKILAKYTVQVTVVLATNIILSTNSYEATEGETLVIPYTLFPNNASDYGLEWRSANNEVATVDGTGRVEAVAAGQTTISVTNSEGLFATCSVTVKKALPNFRELYGKWESESWFSVADDGSWMRFDGNPNNDDSDDYWKYIDAYRAVDEVLPQVLEELGYSSSVNEKMNHTTWSQGKQTESTDTTTVTWTYHPDKGLEVFFEINK